MRAQVGANVAAVVARVCPLLGDVELDVPTDLRREGERRDLRLPSRALRVAPKAQPAHQIPLPARVRPRRLVVVDGDDGRLMQRAGDEGHKRAARLKARLVARHDPLMARGTPRRASAGTRTTAPRSTRPRRRQTRRSPRARDPIESGCRAAPAPAPPRRASRLGPTPPRRRWRCRWGRRCSRPASAVDICAPPEAASCRWGSRRRTRWCRTPPSTPRAGSRTRRTRLRSARQTRAIRSAAARRPPPAAASAPSAPRW
mmetsp:Transcript_25146/g.66229  ORF Transcript_25146/g.66229 Transcript_25146/m.66229 type:complete len:258 (-) Transcript_25146:135-908(-)